MNIQYFSKDEIRNGTFTDFIKALVEFNITSGTHYNDIHIAAVDCGAVQVEWEEINIKLAAEEGEFKFIDSDHVVMQEVILPDQSVTYAFSEEDARKLVNDWQRKHKKTTVKEAEVEE